MKQLILAIFIAAGLVACTNYGKKVSQDYLEVYYKDGATEEQAQKTLDFLYPLWKEATGKTDKKSVRLTKNGDTINFCMVVDKNKLAQIDDETFYIMSNLFSDSLYNGAPVNMVFSDNSFKPIRTLVFEKRETLSEFGTKATAGNIEVYCKDGFSFEHAQMLADYLQKEVNPAETISFQVGKTKDLGYLVRMVANKEKADELGDASFNKMAGELSTNVFYGGQVTFELTDVKFNPYKQYVVPMQ